MKNFENLIKQFAGDAPYVGYNYMPMVMTELCKLIVADKTFFISVNLSQQAKDKYGKNHIVKTDLSDDKDVDFTINTLKMADGEGLLPAFTSLEQAVKNGETDTFEVDIYQFFDMLVDNENVRYGIINPFDKSVLIDKNMASILLDQFE